MQALIHGQPIDLLTYTISLARTDKQDLFMFHCVGCGQTISQFMGIVKKIYPILEPHSDVPVINKCRKCDKRYTFQTIQAYKDPAIKVVLHSEQQRDYFFCYLGKGTPILTYNAHSIYSIQDKQEKKLPFIEACPDQNCSIEYYFSDLV